MKISWTGYVLIALMLIICIKIYRESDFFNLKCVISDVDGKKYCVRERHRLDEAADKLARTTEGMSTLVRECAVKHSNKPCVIRLRDGYNPRKIAETLPTSEFTAYSENKGEKLAFCLNRTKDGKALIDDNTLMFVAIHELAHIASKSVGHTDEFWTNFKFLLQEAEKIGIYTPVDYKNNPKRYCGMVIDDNPYYDY